MKHDEAARVAAIKKGDKRVYADVYEAYVDEIYAFVAWKVESDAMVEDLVSEIFVKGFDRIENCCANEPVNIRAWLYTIARNAVTDYWRKHTEAALPYQYEAIDSDLWGQLEKVDTQHRVGMVLHFLHEECGDDVYDIFIMRFWQQLSYSEITAVNGKSIANNKKLFSRASKQLREEFGEVEQMVADVDAF